MEHIHQSKTKRFTVVETPTAYELRDRDDLLLSFAGKKKLAHEKDIEAVCKLLNKVSVKPHNDGPEHVCPACKDSLCIKVK